MLIPTVLCNCALWANREVSFMGYWGFSDHHCCYLYTFKVHKQLFMLISQWVVIWIYFLPLRACASHNNVAWKPVSVDERQKTGFSWFTVFDILQTNRKLKNWSSLTVLGNVCKLFTCISTWWICNNEVLKITFSIRDLKLKVRCCGEVGEQNLLK